ncbi:MAG: 16S rRNA (cytosine(967)-C(5))-methyltransferase RsmB [Woeseiaceae bacterium]|nr:16S rRNA (cytosine(967)-C(5))-methyltransferase RsmB [Woeseiaceae bacterium]
MSAARAGARARAAAARAVDDVAERGRSLDDALAAREAAFPAADRALIRMLAYSVLRHYWQLSAWIDALLERPLKQRDRVVHALLAVGLAQLSKLRVPDHAAVSATVEAARVLGRPRHAGLVNALLRRFVREPLPAAGADDREAHYDHPGWLIDATAADWPDDWPEILAANNARAPMWLRVNLRRISRDTYLERLRQAGIGATGLPAIGSAVRLAEPLPVADLPGFADGDVSVQDAAAQVAAPLVLERRATRVLDACAAPGGKSAHLLEMSGDEVELTCVDVDDGRLERVADTLARLGRTATLVAGDASSPESWWDGRPFDAVLLDAPCSASGVIRRHPDIKLLRRPSDIGALAARQRALLESCWSVLAPGGRLVYATCSVLAAENDAVVAAFLDARDDGREATMLHNNNIRDVMRPKVRGAQILPGAAGMDGFYYACLDKVA